jgi:inosine-uridine nucleoside N-ribohydrolase
MRRQSARRARSVLALAGTLGLVLLGLLLLALALPVPLWRTGETALPPLASTPGAPLPRPTHRVWIDTDPACGTGATRDPDDCLALLLLLRTDEIEVVGISSVFGNADLAETDRTLQELLVQLRADGVRAPPAWRGCAVALEDAPCPPATPAVQALMRALHAEPLTILALGPLTNVAAVLDAAPQLSPRVARLVAVMGRRPGHRFHPSTARQARPSADAPTLLGHGPVFRDLNVVLDRRAARAVLAAALPLTLVPYDAARQVLFTPHDLQRLADSGPAARWVAEASASWLQFWRTQAGVDGFFPFDLVAAAHLLLPARFDCPRVHAWLGRDPLLSIFERAPALLVTQDAPPPSALAQATARYCTGTDVRVRELFE